MRSVIRLFVPIAMLLVILVTSLTLRWILSEQVPPSVNESVIGNITLGAFSVTMAIFLVFVAGRILTLVVARQLDTDRQRTVDEALVYQDDPVPQIRNETLVGVPSNGVLTIERLSDDPVTRKRIEELRRKERLPGASN